MPTDTSKTVKKKTKRTTKRKKATGKPADAGDDSDGAAAEVNAGTATQAAAKTKAESATQVDLSAVGDGPAAATDAKKRAPRKRSRKKKVGASRSTTTDEPLTGESESDAQPADPPPGEPAEEKKKPSRRGKRSKKRAHSATREAEQKDDSPPPAVAVNRAHADRADRNTHDDDDRDDIFGIGFDPEPVDETPETLTENVAEVSPEKVPERVSGRTRDFSGDRRNERGDKRKPRRRTPRPPRRSNDDELDDDDDDLDFPAATGKVEKSKRTMLINVSAGDECRIAVVYKGRLEELFIERASSQSHVGNIYKGRVTNVEPSIQAAFVDFGLQKNGFLHISDVQPQYFPDYDGAPEDVGRKIPRRNRPPIQECFRRGQEVIVQVIKEGVGTKGPTLTTYLSIPGRFLVMMPGMSRHGVSRKIEDEEARRTMRSIMNEMTFPAGIGFILRTAGMGQSKRELQRDLNYLTRLWKTVIGRIKQLKAPAELYQESDLVMRTIRDVYTADFERVIVDEANAAKRANEFLQIAMPRSKVALEFYSEREPLFHRFGIENEIDNISKRQVPLPSGGSLVIESTEALVAIDVNSGKFRTPEDAEQMAYQLNLEAAEEIARQLRLRDLGGLIVCDFIDMRMDRHKRAVERALRESLKNHKERAKILRMSAFGLIELTRQRRGPSMKRNTFFECRHCSGTGLIKMPESVVLDVMRIVQLAAHTDRIKIITVSASNDVAFQILNRKRPVITALEEDTNKQIVIRGEPGFTDDQVEYCCEDDRGQVVPFNPMGYEHVRSRS